MQKAAILKNLMLEKEYKLSGISRLSEIPYSTLKYIFENGIDNTSYSNVLKICQALEISLDELEVICSGKQCMINENNLSFCKNLKNIRLRNGLSQKEMANNIGVAKSTYSLYESGKREPNIKTIIKLSKILNVSTDTLMGLTHNIGIDNNQSSETKLTENLDILLSERNINKAILAKESGVPYTTIVGLYKKGSENIKLSTLKKICSYFNCSLDYLTGNNISITEIHFTNDEYSKEELNEISNYAKYIKYRKK